MRAGFIPATHLQEIAPYIQLLTPAALAYKRLALVAYLDNGTHIAPAGAGAGYRSWAVALEFYKAGQGDKRLREKWDIASDLEVAIAYPPGTHGSATRIDMLFNGHSPDAHNIALAGRYGFTREFGDRDKNHFMHDGQTAVHGVRGYDKIRLTARYLNTLHLGKYTAAEETGTRDENFIWLVQDYGNLKHIYAGPKDGVTGPHTEHAFDLIWDEVVAGK